MKLTAKQRAEVVELLRCAADANSLGVAAECLLEDPISEPWEWARHARQAVNRELRALDYSTQCLEAAARVEEGSWP